MKKKSPNFLPKLYHLTPTEVLEVTFTFQFKTWDNVSCVQIVCK